MSASAQVESFVRAFTGLRTEVEKLIVGQAEIITGVLTGMFAGGHVLLEGVPGLGKTLLVKTQRALAESARERLVVVGGVGANSRLRERLRAMTERQGVEVFFPRVEFCTDNAAMIAVAGLWRLKQGQREGLPIHARARWPLDTLSAPGAA